MPAPVLSRRSLLGTGLAASLTPLLGACGSDGASGQSSRRRLLIGAVLELSGAGSTIGTCHRNGVNITLEKIRRHGLVINGISYDVQVQVMDNKSDVATTTVVTQQLADAGVAAVIGGGLAETAVAMGQVAQERELPAICMTSADDLVLPVQLRRFVFKLGPNGADVAQRMVTEMRRRAMRRVALLAVEGPHGDSGVTAMSTALSSAGLVVAAAERFTAGSPLTGQLRRVIAARPDAVVVWALGSAPAEAVSQLRAAGWNGQVFLDPGAGNLTTLAPQVREAMDGAILVHPELLTGSQLAITNPAGLAQRDFFERYTQLYGTFDATAAYAWDSLQLILNAARRRSATDRAALRRGVEYEPFEGIVGAYAFSPIRHGGVEPSTLAVFLIRAGEWSRVS